MAGKTRTDKNSVTAAVGSFSGAMDSVPLPQGVELRSEEEIIIWEQFTRARAREDWRDMDLLLLAKTAFGFLLGFIEGLPEEEQAQFTIRRGSRLEVETDAHGGGLARVIPLASPR